MYDKCYFCLDQLPKLKKESTASFFVNFGGAGVQKSRPTLLYSLETSWGLLGCNLVSTLAPLGDYSMITSGEYFCPVGDIWPFFSFAFNQVKTSTFYPPQHSTELFMALVINGRLCEVFSFLLASFDFQTTARL